MLLFLLLLAAEPGSNLDLPPASDPTGRWIATSIAALTVIGPLVAARIQSKKGTASGPTPSVPESVTPRLDASQGYLERYVASLEHRVEQTEARNAELDRKYLELLDKYSATNAKLATTQAQLEAVHHDNLEMRDELHLMRGQMRGRGRDER